MHSPQIGRFSSPVLLLFMGLNRLFQPLCGEEHKDTWIFNTKPPIRLTGKWSHRWVPLHNADDDDDNDNNNSDNAYWYAAIFREKSQRAGHYTVFVLMMVCLCAKSEKWVEDHRKCNDLDNEPCNNWTEAQLSYTRIVSTVPTNIHLYSCETFSQRFGRRFKSYGKCLVNNTLILQKSLMPPPFGSVQSKNCCNYTKKGQYLKFVTQYL